MAPGILPKVFERTVTHGNVTEQEAKQQQKRNFWRLFNFVLSNTLITICSILLVLLQSGETLPPLPYFPFDQDVDGAGYNISGKFLTKVGMIRLLPLLG